MADDVCEFLFPLNSAVTNDQEYGERAPQGGGRRAGDSIE